MEHFIAKTENADAVLAFWFEEISPEQWFKKDGVFDETIKIVSSRQSATALRARGIAEQTQPRDVSP